MQEGQTSPPKSEVCPELASQIKLLVSVTGHLGLKFSDYMLVYGKTAYLNIWPTKFYR